jgi:O-antigen/teichoic acid export membrane protein
MMKTILYYIISNAISRGAFILYSTILLSLLSLENFGLYNLIFILSMLISPILVLGGGSVILREGVNSHILAYQLFIKYTLFTIVFSLLLFFCVYYLDDSKYHWISYSILFASVEAVFLLVLAYFRTVDKPRLYLYISFLKFIVVLSVFAVSFSLKYSFSDILFLQFLTALFVAILLVLFIFKTAEKSTDSIYDKYQLFMFGLMLIPHGLSQWMMSSSDRVIIKYMLNDEMLGIYSVGYIVASVLLLINSGIGLALPQLMIKNYLAWKKNKEDLFWIKIYAIVDIVLLLLIEIFFILDKNIFHLLKYYTVEMYLVFSFAYLGISILGFYYFYANYLFYFKKSKTISTQTFYAAMSNILLTTIFIYWIGVVGAAVATMFSYLFYLFLVRKEALKLEIELKNIDSYICNYFYKLMIIIVIILTLFYTLTLRK